MNLKELAMHNADYANYKPGDKPSGKDYTYILRWIAYAEKLEKALRDIADDCAADYPPSHGAIKHCALGALGSPNKPAGDQK